MRGVVDCFLIDDEFVNLEMKVGFFYIPENIDSVIPVRLNKGLDYVSAIM